MTTALAATRTDSVATSRLRMTAYCLLLTAAAFIQEPGRIVADTKWDLAENPLGFLGRALHMWDPLGAFGQVQNQAYGYFWPMGPFFALGDLLGLPAWVTQRLWWSLLLCVAFVGVVKLCKAMGIGVPWTQVLGGFAYALSVHTLTLLGPTSIEAWPSALAPWVLLPLVRGSEGGSVRRAGALAALAVLMCGGVNAVATAAVLPLGVVWIATRSSGARRRALLGWWTLGTALATVWWWLPLLVLGRYSPPFLDYIENAAITTSATGLGDVVGGHSDWVAYVSATDWRAGNLLGTTPFLLLDAAALAALGVAGICRRDNPHRWFLLAGLLVGIAIVTFGYAGAGLMDGWWAEARRDMLDGALAPLRNLHKFDPVIRLPLVLGMVHFVSVFKVGVGQVTRVATTSVSAMAIVAVVGIASPVYLGKIAPAGSFEDVPDYWRQTATYLNDQGSASGRVLIAPAAAFGDYTWGSTHDEVLQPLLDQPWAVRNVVPLAQPGNVRLLDAVTRSLESGEPDDHLAALLTRNGVSTLVIRNDLDAFRTGAPDPVVLHQALDRSAGLSKVAEFGPTVGSDGRQTSDAGDRIFASRGRTNDYASVEVYAVDGAATATAWDASTVPVAYADPGVDLARAGLAPEGFAAVPTVLAGDAAPAFDESPRVLSDGMARREVAFAYVRENESATLTRDQQFTTEAVEPYYRLFDDDDAFLTVQSWSGVSSVTASSAQSDADAVGTIDPAAAPAAAADGDPQTSWQSTGLDGAIGQWWQVDLTDATSIGRVRITMGDAVGPEVTELRLETDRGSEIVEAPPPGTSRTYDLPAVATSRLRIVVDDVAGASDGVQVRIADVQLPDVAPIGALQTPLPSGPVDLVVLQRGRTRSACALVDTSFRCDDLWDRNVEGGDVLARDVRLDAPGSYRPAMVASLRPTDAATSAVANELPRVPRTSSVLSADLRASAIALVDRSRATTWIADVDDARPRVELRWTGPVSISQIRLPLVRSVAASRPEEIVLRAGDQRRRVRLAADGAGAFDPIRTDRLEIEIVASATAYSRDGADLVPMPVGASGVSFPSSRVPRVDPSQPIDLGCGSGPTMDVDGVTTQTRVTSSLVELMWDSTWPVEACSDDPVELRADGNLVRALPSAVSRPDVLTLTATDVTVGPPAELPVVTGRWDVDRRTLQVAERTEPALLVVNENFNEGWEARSDGRLLASQRVDGWKQGWILPAGGEATVDLVYTPDRTYQLGLLAGLLGAVAVGALALWRRGRVDQAALTAGASHPWVEAGLVIVLLGVIAGWVGLALAIGSLALRWWARDDVDLGPVAGLLVLGAGVVQAFERGAFNATTHWGAQLLIVASIAIGAAEVVAKRPTFLSRRNGRSSA